ncbi:MAG TPA: ACT domain-containing protein [bacterium]|nr:ACT domain-containing protein [bacterium]HPI78624.1 ACT domain-containing protein [bacterium]
MAVQAVVFMQNMPGRLARMTGALAGAGVNIRATAISSSEGFGVAKFLVDKPEIAAAALKDAGFPVALKNVVAVKMDDTVGGLDRILPLLQSRNINVEDAYGFILERGKEAVFVFEVDQPEDLGEFLSRNGCSVMSESDLYGL